MLRRLRRSLWYRRWSSGRPARKSVLQFAERRHHPWKDIKQIGHDLEGVAIIEMHANAGRIEDGETVA